MRKCLNISIIIILIVTFGCTHRSIDNCQLINRLPDIFPDYNNVVVPPNIAPLNFYVNDSASGYHVEIYSKNGKKIILNQSSPSIEIPINEWTELLNKNKGNRLTIDVYSNKKDKWYKYASIQDSVVTENVDNYLVYRLINPAYIFWSGMGIYQRNVGNFEQSAIFENKSSENGCVNCHMFSKNNPEKMTLHFRKEFAGTVIKDGNSIRKIKTKTPYTMGPFAYPSWNPNGEIIAYSVNIIRQVFRTNQSKPQDVYDEASDIVIYNVKTNTVSTSPKISTQDRENLPTWSPDGKYLYYISAPDKKKFDASNSLRMKYSLLRIAYDEKNNTWGDVDTVLSSNQTGKSISFPVISPDGKYLMFCMTDYGYFTIFHKMSDLYLLNLETREYRKLDINSDKNESYHSWSSNGRWFVFSSKRIDDLHSRTYFCYFDSTGKEHKAFVLPQKNPLFYKTFAQNYNRPELVTGKVMLDAIEMRDIVRRDAEDVKFDSLVDVNALSGATWIKKNQ